MSGPEDRGRILYYDKCVGDALASGIRQYVILGAGFDSRPYRLAGPGCKVFEVDHPATGRVKRQRVAKAGLDASDVTWVGVDFLRQDTRQRLVAEGLDPGLPTLFTWEGVTMYLDETRDNGRSEAERAGHEARADALLNDPGSYRITAVGLVGIQETSIRDRHQVVFVTSTKGASGKLERSYTSIQVTGTLKNSRSKTGTPVLNPEHSPRRNA